MAHLAARCLLLLPLLEKLGSTQPSVEAPTYDHIALDEGWPGCLVSVATQARHQVHQHKQRARTSSTENARCTVRQVAPNSAEPHMGTCANRAPRGWCMVKMDTIPCHGNRSRNTSVHVHALHYEQKQVSNHASVQMSCCKYEVGHELWCGSNHSLRTFHHSCDVKTARFR